MNRSEAARLREEKKRKARDAEMMRVVREVVSKGLVTCPTCKGEGFIVKEKP